jgi:hypothetical protein
MAPDDWSDIWKLWATAWIVGILWQPETDITNYIANDSATFLVDSPAFTLREIWYNFLMFIFVHGVTFAVISRWLRAGWANWGVDF